MLALALDLLLANESPGRGGSPDEGWGVVTVLATILVAAAVVGTVLALIVRRSRRSPRGDAGRDRPHPPGTVGRSG